MRQRRRRLPSDRRTWNIRRAEAYCRAALHDADELICVLVDLRADVAVCGYAHQRYLQMLARPCLFSEICVLFRLAVNVHDCRCPPQPQRF